MRLDVSGPLSRKRLALSSQALESGLDKAKRIVNDLAARGKARMGYDAGRRNGVEMASK
jgi:hypothetical protein